MATAETIRSIIDAAAPELEKTLGEYGHPFMDTIAPPDSMQLRLPWCGPVSVALQTYLQEKYSISTDVVINHLDEAPRGPNFRILNHVALAAENTMIDATPTQFMSLVGLTPESALQHELTDLYPDPKVLVYDFEQARNVANTFAEHAFSTDRSGVIPFSAHEYGADGALRGKSLIQMQHAYRSIWNPAKYRPWLDNERSEATRSAAQRIGAALLARAS